MIVVYGSFNADYVWRTRALPAPGQTCLGSFASAPGGKGFNQAVAAHRLGARAHFVGALGQDAGASMARNVAADLGLPCTWLSSTAPTGSASVVVDANARNQIVVAPGANLTPGPAEVLQVLQTLQPQAVLVQLECAEATTLAVLRWARAQGVLAMLNPAPAHLQDAPALLAACDVLTPNETEFEVLHHRCTGRTLPGPVAELDDATLHAACRALDVPTVVITLGAAGALVSHGVHPRGDAHPYLRVPTPTVQAIDTTGAGDCFNGALLACLQARPELPFSRHVHAACAAAAWSTERRGAALAMPDADEWARRYTEAPQG